MRNMYDPSRKVGKLVGSIHNDIEDAIDAAYLLGQEWMHDECLRAVTDEARLWEDEGDGAEAAVCRRGGEGGPAMTINETIAEILRLEDTPVPSGAWDLIEQHAYYRTATPALAREVQRLQEQVSRLLDARTIDRLQAHGDGYQDGHRAGQEAMRERCAARVDRAANEACECDGTLCGPDDVAPHDEDCRRFDLDDLAQAIRALEVER